MICPACGQEADDRNGFCPRCGAAPAAPEPPPPPGTGPGPSPAPSAPRPDARHGYAQPAEQVPARQAPPSDPYLQPAGTQNPYRQQPYGGQAYAHQPVSPTPPYPAQGPYHPQGQQYWPAPPPGAPYQQQFAASGRRGSVVAGVMALLAGAALVASTFLPWVSMSAMGYSASVSGYGYMTGTASGSGSGSFSVVLTGGGVVFFTGFFSLLFGALVMAGGLVTLFRRRLGGVLVFAFALPAAGLAAVDVAMAMTKVSGGSASVGIWMFAGAAFAALATGIAGLVSPG